MSSVIHNQTKLYECVYIQLITQRSHGETKCDFIKAFDGIYFLAVLFMRKGSSYPNPPLNIYIACEYKFIASS